MSEARITRAAIMMCGDPGDVWSLPRPARHCHIINLMVDAGQPMPIKGIQGFLTSSGSFVNRVGAMRVAKGCGQIPQGHASPCLYSEDLW